MGTCQHCHKREITISDRIGACADCIRRRSREIWPGLRKAHAQSRKVYGLPLEPPCDENGLTCPLCMHGCKIPEGGRGFCGLRTVEQGRLRGGRPHEGNLSYYHDPLPTNCVGSFVCPAGTETGYPDYSASRGPEYGYKNLAVFYHACSFNCLYCQNFQYKKYTALPPEVDAKSLAGAVDDRTTCICHFGGDPSPQILHALKASKLALAKAKGRILRICWETNGCLREPYLGMMARLSLESGGCIKFDLKAWDEGIHYALCGVTNKKTLKNFEALSRMMEKRPNPPFLIASTLLVPGYVDEEEIAQLANYIAGLSPDIPYSLLAFYPHFYLNDLPTTSKSHAMRCRDVAMRQGLRNVHLGNIHLLGEDYT